MTLDLMCEFQELDIGQLDLMKSFEVLPEKVVLLEEGADSEPP